MRTALVTGAAGFIGRHLVPELQKEYEVVPLDSAPPYRSKFSAARKFGRHDLVVHLAANIVNVDRRSKQGVRAFADLKLDYDVLSYVQEHPPRERFLAMSSCAVDTEEDPYGYVKRTLERMVRALPEDVPVSVVRPFSGYGSDQSEEYPFGALLRRALRHEDPLVVWGGHQVRDFVHVDDLVRALLVVLKSPPQREPLEVGTGIGTPLFELAELFADEAGYCPSVELDGSRAVSSLRRVADPSRMRALGWEPEVLLEAGVRRAVHDHRS